MKPNAELVDMARRAASIKFAAALLVTPALAGDRALIELIGYSDDARYFAFEEFGVQDGSGFPYSNIYVLDLPADKWVKGSPVRARLDGEAADLAQARKSARQQAQSILTTLDVTTPAEFVALNADGETAGDARVLEFGMPGYGLAPPQNVRTLALETFPADSAEPCESYLGEKALGFALSLDGVELHRDQKLPQSRGCPLEYKVFGVVRQADWVGTDAGAVAIVAVYPFGFEGPDRRFIAVPLGS